MVERVLPLAAVDRLIRKSGSERVSESAAEELAQILEDVGIKISQKASELSKHANRKTITGPDIRLAHKNL